MVVLFVHSENLGLLRSYIEYRYGQNRAYKGLGQSSPHLLAFGVDLALDQIQEKEIIRDFRALISLHIQGV